MGTYSSRGHCADQTILLRFDEVSVHYHMYQFWCINSVVFHKDVDENRFSNVSVPDLTFLLVLLGFVPNSGVFEQDLKNDR